ncbi:hypothetical protein RO3G_11655 [Lichtheimia corymbifera JMRC:FSU:9682]|uniref:Uncharacterized protein n=1 Tax=Lichtheimia corymbifera JMRC:FSU:9682 TaxID=1263082 RepID=A0A068S7M6_9FUNG|nr:hypothetical protein RO3G_11655 [Lichtheimia corymbifera JMRC:FSU:9682]
MTCITHTSLATPNSSPDDVYAKDHQKKQQQQQQQQHPSSYHEQQRAYVGALVDVTVQAIASIWPTANNVNNGGNSSSQQRRPVANLEQFLYHILKHSRTTHSTLQLAIFYLFRIRSRVLQHRHDNVYIACGRRMFLASLICAHKFLQDKTYKNLAWSKVSGLSVKEINHAERVMLQLLDWSLYVKKDTYDQWIQMLNCHLKCRSCTVAPAAKNATNTTTHATITNNNNIMIPTVLHTLTMMSQRATSLNEETPATTTAALLLTPPCGLSPESCGNTIPITTTNNNSKTIPSFGPGSQYHPITTTATKTMDGKALVKYGMPTPDQANDEGSLDKPNNQPMMACGVLPSSMSTMRSPERKRKAVDIEEHENIKVKRVTF